MHAEVMTQELGRIKLDDVLAPTGGKFFRYKDKLSSSFEDLKWGSTCPGLAHLNSVQPCAGTKFELSF